MNFRILFQDPYLVAIDKPAGFQVHPPEDTQHKISRGTNCLFLLRKQIDTYLYPIHRLDRATSGVLIFALQAEAARRLSACFSNAALTPDAQVAERRLRKIYYCVVRGWTEDEGVIEAPLKSENGESLLDARTAYRRVGRIEVPHAVGPYQTARYSLVRVEPATGRMHQIRRHFARISHPLVGDSIYGDGAHNRFFRAQYGTRNLLLKAYSLEVPHPETGIPLRITSRWGKDWNRVFDLFGVCPFDQPMPT